MTAGREISRPTTLRKMEQLILSWGDWCLIKCCQNVCGRLYATVMIFAPIGLRKSWTHSLSLSIHLSCTNTVCGCVHAVLVKRFGETVWSRIDICSHRIILGISHMISLTRSPSPLEMSRPKSWVSFWYWCFSFSLSLYVCVYLCSLILHERLNNIAFVACHL